ncbi:MAG: PA0069 family radical SAM protein [Burkholderiaceae bacterium]
MSSSDQSSLPIIRLHRGLGLKGRGAGSNAITRFSQFERSPDTEFLNHLSEAAPHDLEGEASGVDNGPRTEVTMTAARSIISRNTSPDLPFDQSINPYQGCEHGCVYCYARPTHTRLGLSAGLDFETRLFAKTNAADLLRAELSRPGYEPGHMALGANTDPYQPIERKLEITRQVLKVLAQFNVPVGITTKSALVSRDVDILAPMAAKGLARVHISIATLDTELARTLEPRAPTPARRLEAIARLSNQGIPVGVFTSPLIPALNDTEMEHIMTAAQQAGASSASYVMLRLPLEVRDLFVQWLRRHAPLRADHVMSQVRQMRDGKDYDADFRVRMRGTGPYAKMIAQRFKVAARRLELNTDRTSMDTSQFRVPGTLGAQADLFD